MRPAGKIPCNEGSSSICGDSRFGLQEELHLPVRTAQSEATRHAETMFVNELGIRMSMLRPQIRNGCSWT